MRPHDFVIPDNRAALIPCLLAAEAAIATRLQGYRAFGKQGMQAPAATLSLRFKSPNNSF